MADNIKRILAEKDMLAADSAFENVFYASDLSENFINMIDHIFEGERETANVKFLNFDLENGEQII